MEAPVENQPEGTAETQVETQTDTTENILEEVEKEDELKKSITLSFVGDCLLGSDLSYGSWNSFVEVFEKQNRDATYFFKNVKPIFEKDDITIGNLENPLTKSTVKAKKEFVFKGDPDYTNILKEGSMEVVNIENNHTYDYFDIGYQDTKKNLTNAEIGFYGDTINYIKEVNGIKVGFLGYRGQSDNATIRKKILQGINKLKENGVTIVAVSFHWGQEKNYYSNNVQKSLARYTIDSGADLIVGHHPHVIQGIEIYKDKPIVYSLGNFCFGGNRNPSDKDTFIFQQTFNFDEENKISTSSKIIPCSISSVSNKNDFVPTPLTGKNANNFLARMLTYSKGKNSEQFIKDSFHVFENSEGAK